MHEPTSGWGLGEPPPIVIEREWLSSYLDASLHHRETVGHKVYVVDRTGRRFQLRSRGGFRGLDRYQAEVLRKRAATSWNTVPDGVWRQEFAVPDDAVLVDADEPAP